MTGRLPERGRRVEIVGARSTGLRTTKAQRQEETDHRGTEAQRDRVTAGESPRQEGATLDWLRGQSPRGRVAKPGSPLVCPSPSLCLCVSVVLLHLTSVPQCPAAAVAPSARTNRRLQ